MPGDHRSRDAYPNFDSAREATNQPDNSFGSQAGSQFDSAPQGSDGQPSVQRFSAEGSTPQSGDHRPAGANPAWGRPSADSQPNPQSWNNSGQSQPTNQPFPMPSGQAPMPNQSFPQQPANQSYSQAPGAPRPFYAPQRQGDFRPTEVRIARDAGAPLAVLIIGALLAFGLSALVGAGNPVVFLIGMVPSLIGLAIGLGTYLWLDRWEPEPPRLLLTAFVWGGGVTTVGALIIGRLLSLIGLNGDFFGKVIQAPFVEEALKGAFLLIMLTGARRREMTTLTDHLVYAGWTAFGFAFVENLLYFSGAESWGEIVFMTLIRTGVNLFGHALYTSCTAIGIYYARKEGDKIKALPIIIGYLVAVLLHALWNGSAFFGLQVLGLVYIVILVPAFIYVVKLGLNSRKEEGAIVANQLGRMVSQGIVSPQDAQWLSQLESRQAARKGQDSKTPEGKRVRDVADAVTELAIIRNRLDSMSEPSQYLLEEERYLTAALTNESGRLAGRQAADGSNPGQQFSAQNQGFPASPPSNSPAAFPTQYFGGQGSATASNPVWNPGANAPQSQPQPAQTQSAQTQSAPWSTAGPTQSGTAQARQPWNAASSGRPQNESSAGWTPPTQPQGESGSANRGSTQQDGSQGNLLWQASDAEDGQNKSGQ